MTSSQIEIKAKVDGQTFTLTVDGDRLDWAETWYVRECFDSNGNETNDVDVWHTSPKHLTAIHDSMIDYFSE